MSTAPLTTEFIRPKSFYVENDDDEGETLRSKSRMLLNVRDETLHLLILNDYLRVHKLQLIMECAAQGRSSDANVHRQLFRSDAQTDYY